MNRSFSRLIHFYGGPLSGSTLESGVIGDRLTIPILDEPATIREEPYSQPQTAEVKTFTYRLYDYGNIAGRGAVAFPLDAPELRKISTSMTISSGLRRAVNIETLAEVLSEDLVKYAKTQKPGYLLSGTFTLEPERVDPVKHESTIVVWVWQFPTDQLPQRRQ